MTRFDSAVLIFVLLGLGVVGTMVHFDRIRRQIRRIERLSLAGDVDGARGAALDWERTIRKKDINQRILIAREWSKLGDHGRSLSILDDTKVPPGRYWRRFRWAADDLRHQELWAAGRSVEAGELKAAMVARDPEAPWLVSALLRHVRSSGDPEELDKAIDLGMLLVRRNSLSLDVALELYLTARGSARSADALLVMEAIVDSYRRAERRPWVRISRVFWHRLFALLGEARLAAGDERGGDEAFAQALDRALDKDAAEAFVARLRANGLFDARRFDEAADAYQRVLATGEDGNALLGLIECHRRGGKLYGGFEALQRAREAGGDATWADLLEARLLSDTGRPAEAEGIVLRCCGEHAIDRSTLYTLAYVRVSHGLPGAERVLRRLATLYPWLVDGEDLFDQPAPDGATWRRRLEVAPRPDA